MSAKTCDYAGNGGYLEAAANLKISDIKKRGAIPLLYPRWTASRIRLGEIRDGSSNTLLLWESAGAEWYRKVGGKTLKGNWYEWHDQATHKFSTVKIFFDENRDLHLACSNYMSSGYFAAWAGLNRFRLRVWDEEALDWGSYRTDGDTFSRTVNATNAYRNPFGFHPQICVVAFADGSIRTIEQTIDPATMTALTSRFGGESVSGDY